MRIGNLVEAARFAEIEPATVILKTNVTDLPSVRLASRFGLHGDWIELVGYDLALPRVTMYWRPSKRDAKHSS